MGFSKVLLAGTFLLLLMVAIQAVLYPPNNFDSLTYHLSRTVHWAENGSVGHYATNIYRQVYQPPFAEFVILHVNLLTGTDVFSNLVQFVFLLGCVAGVTLLAGDGERMSSGAAIAAMVLVVTMPEAILQASSTQNDVVLAFFILAAAYFVLRAARSGGWVDHVLLGLAAGLALLTKGTAYILLLPLALVYAFLWSRKLLAGRGGVLRITPMAILALVMAIMVNSGHYSRNLSLTGSPLGVDAQESAMYRMPSADPRLVALNLVKNIGLHAGPGPLAGLRDQMVFKLHLLLGVDPDIREVNFNGMRYFNAPAHFNHEDFAPNPLHLAAILLAAAILLWRWRKGRHVSLLWLAVVTLQLLLFAAYLKWQPWHTRLHVPMFMLALPAVVTVMHGPGRAGQLLRWLLVPMLLYGAVVMVLNRTRPLVRNAHTSVIGLQHGRYHRYFTNMPERLDEYEKVVGLLDGIAEDTVGIMLHIDDWEYPLYVNETGRSWRPLHIGVNNPTGVLEQPITPGFIIATLHRMDVDGDVEHGGLRYVSLTPEHGLLHLLKQE